MADPEIKIEKLRMIFLYNLSISRQPIASKFWAYISPVFEKVVGLYIQRKFQMGWAVECSELGVVHVRCNGAAGIHKPIMFDAVRRRSEIESFLTNGLG